MKTRYRVDRERRAVQSPRSGPRQVEGSPRSTVYSPLSAATGAHRSAQACSDVFTFVRLCSDMFGMGFPNLPQMASHCGEMRCRAKRVRFWRKKYSLAAVGSCRIRLCLISARQDGRWQIADGQGDQSESKWIKVARSTEGAAMGVYESYDNSTNLHSNFSAGHRAGNLTRSFPLARPSRACGFARIPFAASQAAQVTLSALTGIVRIVHAV